MKKNKFLIFFILFLTLHYVKNECKPEEAYCGNECINPAKEMCCEKDSQFYPGYIRCPKGSACCDVKCCNGEFPKCCRFWVQDTRCIREDETCCNRQVCPSGVACCNQYDKKCCDGPEFVCQNNKCVLILNYSMLFLPIIFDLAGIFLIVSFIYRKRCNKKDFRDSIIHQSEYVEQIGSHTKEEKNKELNPDKIMDQILKKGVNSKSEFENAVLGHINQQFYFSSIVFFVILSIPPYITLIFRINFWIVLSNFVLLSLRLLHLCITTQGLSFIRSTRVHFASAVFSIAPFVLCLLNDFPDSVDKRTTGHIFPTILLFFINGCMFLGPWSYIKVERTEEFLIMSGVTFCGGSSKDQYGNVRSGSLKDACSVKIAYPENLKFSST